MPRRLKSDSLTTRNQADELTRLFPTLSIHSYKDMVSRSNDEAISELVHYYKERGLVLFIGSGVSRSVQLPSWRELMRSMAMFAILRRFILASTRTKDRDYQWIDKYTSNFDYLLDTIDENRSILMLSRPIQAELDQGLNKLVADRLYRNASKASEIPSSPLMDIISALSKRRDDYRGIRAIINYNYDDFLDIHLRKSGVSSCSISTGKDFIPSGFLPCFHVHGIIPFEEYRNSLSGGKKSKGLSSNKLPIVFAEKEYHTEYTDLYKWSNVTQLSHMTRHTGLFIGLSLEDPNIRRLLDVVNRQYPTVQHYAILTRKKPAGRLRSDRKAVHRNLMESMETEAFKTIGVKVLWVDSYKEVPAILEKINSLL
jgi:hypothetical protein